MFTINFVACSASPNISQQQKEFNILIDTIDELEKLSYNYAPEDVMQRVLIYIRSERYNTTQWNVLAGEPDVNFDAYVMRNEQNNISDLKKLDSFVIPSTNEYVDFVHMVATINVNYVSFDTTKKCDLSGWGGDLCQLALEANNSKKTDNELYNYIKQQFNNDLGGFNNQDVCADLDAVNLAFRLLSNENVTLSNAMKDYYQFLTAKDRKTNFIKNVFGKNYRNATELKSDIFSRVTSNELLNFWCYTNNFSMNDNLEIFDICCEIFSNYLLNID